MHSLFLWDNKKLVGLNANAKNKKINEALKRFRMDEPESYIKRLTLIASLSLIPSLALCYLIDFRLAIVWFSVSAMAFEFRIAKKESPLVCNYIK